MLREIDKLAAMRALGLPTGLFSDVSEKSTPVKSCSSSEVAAMIEGLLRHCTDTGIDGGIETNYVDTHGASVVGFAFTELLGFRLLPRLKNIGEIRLYRPDEQQRHATLGPVLTRPIRWDLIAQQYDQ